MRWFYITFALVGLNCARAALAQANGLPDPTPEIRRQELRQEQLRREQEVKPSVTLLAEPKAQPTRLPQETPCREITEVAFEGLAELDAVLQAALAGDGLSDGPLGQCIGVQGIGVLVDRARNALIAQGYVTSRVEAPPQDLSSGRLLLRVVMGRIAAIDKGAGLPWIRHTAPLASDNALNLRDIEQSLENLRRNPSVQAEFQLRPGAQADATDIVLDYQRSRPLRLSFGVDDSGTTATGKLIAQGTVSWDSPLGLSDLAYLSANQDAGHRQSGPRGNDGQTLHYSVPWGYWLWSMTASRSNYRQTIAGPFQSYLYSGQTQGRDLQLSRVVHRDANSKTSLQVKGFSRRSSNFIDDTEVQVQRRSTAGWEAGLQHSHFFGQLSGDLQLSYKRGTGAWGSQPAPEELFGEGNSRMQVGTAVLNVQWPVSASPRVTATHQLRLQVNRTPLVPQDRLCLGGRYSVRGFDGLQSLCGDRGYLWRNDLIWALNEQLSPYAGLDLGRVGGRSAQDLPDPFLAGYVLGLRGQYRLANGLHMSLDVFAGRPFAKPTFLTTASTSTGMSLSLSF